MEFLTGVVASGFLYDLLKSGLAVKAQNIKAQFQGWLIDDALADKLERQFAALDINHDLSESAIAKRIESSTELMALLSNIQPSNHTTITQNHFGTGDNVGGNKIVN